MNAAVRHSPTQGQVTKYGSMKKPLIISCALHAAIVIVSVVGLPYIQKDTPIIDTPISVELVTIDETTQTNRVAAPQNKPKEIEDPKPPEPKPAPPQQKEPPPPPEPEPKKEEPKPEPKVEKKPEPKPEPKKEKPKPEPEPKKEKPKPEPEPKKEEKKSDDAFNSLLKNLAPSEPAEKAPDTKEETGET
ncbi:MAG: hypothetical protein KTR28_05985, partial [Micavibrio sp.]|nr:hypothetical protein [Micavibrio sp.]